jgi:hypothetical protein
MATREPNPGNGGGNGQNRNHAASSVAHRPIEALENTQSTSAAVPQASQAQPSKKRRNHRSNKKKKHNRRQSFVLENEEGEMIPAGMSNRNGEGAASAAARPGLYRLGQSGGGNLSDTSINSDALLDHRCPLLSKFLHCKSNNS